MVKPIIISIIIAFGLTTSIAQEEPVLTAGSQYTKDWWENVYEMRIKKQHYEEIKAETNSRCAKKIVWYKEKLAENPSSEYYTVKLNKWLERCP